MSEGNFESKTVADLTNQVNKSFQENDWETLQVLVEELGRKGKGGEDLSPQALEALVDLIYKVTNEDVKESTWKALENIHSGVIGLKISKKLVNLPQKAEDREQFEIALALLENQLWVTEENRPIVLEQVLEALEKGDEFDHLENRQAAAIWLGDKATEIVSNDRLTGQALDKLIKRVNLKQEEDKFVRDSAWKSMQRIWDAGGWQESGELTDLNPVQSTILSKALKALDKCDDTKIRIATIDWLSDNAETIAQSSYSSYKKVTLALYAITEEVTIADDLRESAGIALRTYWKALHDHQLPVQMNNLTRGKDENEKTLAIIQMADQNTLGSRDSLRLLVDTWVCWIYNEQEPRLVELTSETIRYNRYAVLALIEHFGRRVSDKYISNGSQGEDKEEQKNHIGDNESESDDIALTDGPPSQIDLAVSQPRYQANEEEKQLLVELRIAEQLADMSDPTYFEDAENLQYERLRTEDYQYIQQELKKHAVPVFLRRLPQGQDDDKNDDGGDGETGARIIRMRKEIRENIVRMLGYTGGREAVDALSRQVVGKERMRKSRQDLLDTYYLKPSQERSDQAARILEGSIAESKRTLLILQILNTAVFFVGLILLVIGLYFSMQGDTQASRVAGALAGLGGFTGMIVLLIRDPLARIQNAMANLVQVETAFTSFIWELNLNGTYIQSLYVKNGKLENEEITNTISRIENAMELTMNMVSTYTIDEEPRVVTRINRLDPAAGQAGKTLTIYGQHLLGDSSQKKTRAGQLAIDHQPIGAVPKPWKDNLVKFTLTAEDLYPSLDSDGDKRTIMISLIVDGMETNALPFHLLELPGNGSHQSPPSLEESIDQTIEIKG